MGNRAQKTSSASGIYEQALSHIAEKSGGSYFYAPSADQLVALYKKLSIRLQSSYKFIYRSPHQVMDGTSRSVVASVEGSSEEKTGANSYYVPGVLVPASNIGLFLLLLVPLAFLASAPRLAERYDVSEQDIYRAGWKIKFKAGSLVKQLGSIWPLAERHYLVAESNSVSPKRARLPEGTLTIGAAPNNDLVIDLPSIARRHARIWWDRGRYIVEDLDSETGTFVSYSGEPAKERKISKNALKLGSTVRFGDVKFHLSDSKHIEFRDRQR